MSFKLKSLFLSFLLMLALIFVWQVSTIPEQIVSMTHEQTEYAKFMGKIPDEYGNIKVNNGMPTPLEFAKISYQHLKAPFYDNGPNDKGIGIQLLYSLSRVAIGFILAVFVALPLGFLIGNSALLYRVLDPFIQILKPISPLAWMPIALYTIKDSTTSAIFVIFICSLWPMLMNTAFAVAAVRKDWLNVSRVLEVSPLRKAFLVVLPAAAPTIITGMRISMSIAWLVIIAAEMLVGGTGIGYFVWNQWNNLSIGNVIFAVVLIGLIGMLLDMLFGQLQKKVTYVE